MKRLKVYVKDQKTQHLKTLVCMCVICELNPVQKLICKKVILVILRQVNRLCTGTSPQEGI